VRFGVVSSMALRSLPRENVVAPPPPRIALHDRVSVPDGRVGSVIGLLRRDPDTVLVAFEPGSAHEFSPAELRRI
jgi:hypothetical protein